MVLAALGVVILGVGAFQMMPQDAPAPAPKASGWKPPVAEAPKVEPARNPTVVASLARRDPFDVPDYAKEKTPGEKTIPEVPIKPGVLPAPRFDEGVPAESKRRPGRRPNRRLSGRLPESGFTAEDYAPLPDTELKVEPVRPPAGDGKPSTPAPEAVKPPEPTFDYTLNGVIMGRRPAAVLRDKQGNQRLVTAGGMIDGEATLIEVRPGAAIVDVRGKRLRIELKGDTDAK
ncbi:MAG: type II secretion system protein N [Fimbriimonas sp.]